MVGTHTAFTKAAKSHIAGGKMNNGIIDTAAAESTAGGYGINRLFIG